jgi:hypothetical protein
MFRLLGLLAASLGPVSMVFAATMPMTPLEGSFVFRGQATITNKFRTVYLSAQAHDLNKEMKQYEAQGYVCEFLENDDGECGRAEKVTADDQGWLEKVKTSQQGHWVAFSAATEPPVLDHDFGNATLWTVFQEVLTSDEHHIPQVQYSFSPSGRSLSFFDADSLEQVDFTLHGENHLHQDIDQVIEENGTTLQLTVSCDFERK